MSRSISRILLAFVTICTCGSAAPAMYRWVDENGVTVYSQTPPPSSDAVRLKKQRAPSIDATEAARERHQRQREQVFDELEARKDAEVEKAEQEAEKQRRESSCAAARKNLEAFRNLGPRMIQTPDGRFLRLSEQEVEAQIAKAQGQVNTYCK